MQYLLKTTVSKSKAKDAQPLQFLGLVSLYQAKSGSKVCAFHIQSFVLYRFLGTLSQTKVDLLLCQSELIHSSVQERLLQILKMMQCEFKNSSSSYILPEVNCSDDWVQAYESLGFHTELLDKSNPLRKVFTRKSVIKLSTFTNRIMWTDTDTT